MTNREWLSALNDEEYAKFLKQVECMRYDYGICDRCAYHSKLGYCANPDKECPFTLKDWLGWEHEEARHEA